MKTTSSRFSLLLGDCRKIMPMLGEGITAVVTDPPYGIRLRNGDVDGHRSKWGSIQGDDSQDVGTAIIHYAAVRKLPLVIFASPWMPWAISSRNLIVWDKGEGVGGGGDIKTCLKRTWELIQTARTGRMNGLRTGSVWRFPVGPADSKAHIAAKPVALMEALVRRFTSPGDLVFDPCMGNGTTGVACMNTGRRFVGIEIDPHHYAIAKRRIGGAA